eukprot:gene28786-31974_t
MNENYELELETEMRTFFRRYYTHSRYLSATALPLDSLCLDTPDANLHLKDLYIDMRPYMNRSPFTIRTECSASRAHEVFVGLGLRHLIVVDQHNNIAGMITRKDLDHAAGHGWWRLSHMADAPKHGLSKFLSKVKNIVTANDGHGAMDMGDHGASLAGPGGQPGQVQVMIKHAGSTDCLDGTSPIGVYTGNHSTVAHESLPTSFSKILKSQS